MRQSDKDRKSQNIRGPQALAMTPDVDGFGLGIQVFKIDSQALRPDQNKKDKRLLIQNLENPAFSRKYEKLVEPQPQKVDESRMNRLKKASVIQQANKTDHSSMQAPEKAYTKPNLNIQRRSGTSQKPPHPNSTTHSKPPMASDIPKDLPKMKKMAATTANICPKIPGKQQQKQREQLIVNFPPLENEQLLKFEISQKQIEQKRKELKKKLKKLKQQAPPEEEIKVQQQIEAIDSKNIIEEIVEMEKLDGYSTAMEESIVNIEAYMRGDFNKEEEWQEEVKVKWEGFVNNVQQQMRGEKQPDAEPVIQNPAKNDEQ